MSTFDMKSVLRHSERSFGLGFAHFDMKSVFAIFESSFGLGFSHVDMSAVFASFESSFGLGFATQPEEGPERLWLSYELLIRNEHFLVPERGPHFGV